MPEQPISPKEKMEGLKIVEEQGDASALFDEPEQNPPKINTPEKRASNTGDILDQNEIDELLGTLPTGENQQSKEQQDIIQHITQERIAEEWEQLSETARSVVQNASDEKFGEITEKYKNIPETERKAKVMIVMRRLISKNHPLAPKITSQQEGRMQEAA